MEISKTHYSEIESQLDSCEHVRSNRQGTMNHSDIYTDGKLYYKVWPVEWERSNTVNFAVENGFYNTYVSSALVSLIHDDHGQRGYIMKKGKHLSIDSHSRRDWNTLISNTNRKQRKYFIPFFINK